MLVVGCGNSELSAQMYDDGVTGVTNIDFSRVCVREMLHKHLRARPLMKWQVMDMTAMTVRGAYSEAVQGSTGQYMRCFSSTCRS